MGLQMMGALWLIKIILMGGVLWTSLNFMGWDMMDMDIFYCVWVDNGGLMDTDKNSIYRPLGG